MLWCIIFFLLVSLRVCVFFYGSIFYTASFYIGNTSLFYASGNVSSGTIDSGVIVGSHMFQSAQHSCETAILLCSSRKKEKTCTILLLTKYNSQGKHYESWNLVFNSTKITWSPIFFFNLTIKILTVWWLLNQASH